MIKAASKLDVTVSKTLHNHTNVLRRINHHHLDD